MRPTESFTLWGGSVEVRCYGTMTGNWSMKGGSPKEAEKKNPGILSKVAQLAEECGCRIYAPHPSTFTGKVCRKEVLVDEWIPGVLYRGTYADGTVLDRMGDAYGLASADCMTAVIRDAGSGMVVGAHAGRDSLIDRGRLEGRPARRLESVLFSAAAMLANQRRRLDKRLLRSFLTCGIGPRDFAHEWDHFVHGAVNERMVQDILRTYGMSVVLPPRELGQISLHALARAHLQRVGLNESQIGSDATDTFADRDSYGFPLWHSHRRDGDGKRNFVLVIRRF